MKCHCLAVTPIHESLSAEEHLVKVVHGSKERTDEPPLIYSRIMLLKFHSFVTPNLFLPQNFNLETFSAPFSSHVVALFSYTLEKIYSKNFVGEKEEKDVY